MFPSLTSALNAIFNLFGIFTTPEYDAIIVGSGAGGCPLAQTLIEAGLKVLLVERGKERNPVTDNIATSSSAVLDECTETFVSQDGIVVADGNCLGGATAINLGVWIEETSDWVHKMFGGDEFGSPQDILDAYQWTRERVASPNTQMPGSQTETYIQGLIDAYQNSDDFNLGNVTDEGQPVIDENGVWRTFTTFDPVTGNRRSADTLLDRSSENLDVRTETEVLKVLFDGDFFVPGTANQPTSDVPRARCVLFTSLETACVKPEGRIYVAGGALHTPEILMRSGVGPSGNKVDNSEVRKEACLHACPTVNFVAFMENYPDIMVFVST